MAGVSIGLFGDSGSGKTTQIGEAAKDRYKRLKQRTRLNTADKGGFKSLQPLVKLGIIEVNLYDDSMDPFIWMDEICNAPNLSDDIGLVANDSATSMGEALLQAAAYSTFQIGQRPNQKFTVAKGDKQLIVGSNTDAHYGVIQSFMLKKIWESMKLIQSERDVMWTFLTQRGEEQDSTAVLGGKLVGKALTPKLPTWFTYFWRIESVPQHDLSPLHRLYLTEYPDSAGMGHSFGNSRAPLGQILPPFIEPASIPEAFRLLREAEENAENELRSELGL